MTSHETTETHPRERKCWCAAFGKQCYNYCVSSLNNETTEEHPRPRSQPVVCCPGSEIEEADFVHLQGRGNIMNKLTIITHFTQCTKSSVPAHENVLSCAVLLVVIAKRGVRWVGPPAHDNRSTEPLTGRLNGAARLRVPAPQVTSTNNDRDHTSSPTPPFLNVPHVPRPSVRTGGRGKFNTDLARFKH